MAATLSVLRARLAEAEQAYHAVQMGGQVVTVVDQNGERIEYSKANPRQLQVYIASLESQIRALTGGCGTGPLNVWM